MTMASAALHKFSIDKARKAQTYLSKKVASEEKQLFRQQAKVQKI